MKNPFKDLKEQIRTTAHEMGTDEKKIISACVKLFFSSVVVYFCIGLTAPPKNSSPPQTGIFVPTGKPVGSKVPLKNSFKVLARATFLFYPAGLGYEGISAFRIPKMLEEYLKAPVAGIGLVTETNLSKLIQTRVETYRLSSEVVIAQGASEISAHLKTKDFSEKLEKMTETLLFYINQLEIQCFSNPQQIILSPRLHEILLESQEIHRRVVYNKERIEEALSTQGSKSRYDLRKQPMLSEIVERRLNTLFQQSEQLLIQFLHVRFEIQLTALSGRGTNQTRIFNPFINFNGRQVENWNLSRLETIKPSQLNPEEYHDLLKLYDEQLQRVLVGVYLNTFADGSSFRVNPFFISFNAHEMNSGENRLDFLEGYKQTAFMPEPEQLEALLQEAKTIFLASELPSEPGNSFTLLADRDFTQNHFLTVARYNEAVPHPSPVGGTPLSRVFDSPRPRLEQQGAGVDAGAVVPFRPESRARRGQLLEEAPSLFPQSLPVDGSPIRCEKTGPLVPPAPFRKRGRGAAAPAEVLTKSAPSPSEALPESKRARKD